MKSSLRSRVFTTLYNFSLFFLVFLTAFCLIVSAYDIIVQALGYQPHKSGEDIRNLLVVGGSYVLLGLLSALFMFSRYVTVRSALADIPKDYLPINASDIPEQVFKRIQAKLTYCKNVRAEAEPKIEESDPRGFGRIGSYLEGVRFQDNMLRTAELIEKAGVAVHPSLFRPSNMTQRQYIELLSMPPNSLISPSLAQTYIQSYEAARFDMGFPASGNVPKVWKEEEYVAFMKVVGAILNDMGYDLEQELQDDAEEEATGEVYATSNAGDINEIISESFVGSDKGSRVLSSNGSWKESSAYTDSEDEEGFDLTKPIFRSHETLSSTRGHPYSGSTSSRHSTSSSDFEFMRLHTILSRASSTGVGTGWYDKAVPVRTNGSEASGSVRYFGEGGTPGDSDGCQRTPPIPEDDIYVPEGYFGGKNTEVIPLRRRSSHANRFLASREPGETSRRRSVSSQGRKPSTSNRKRSATSATAPTGLRHHRLSLRIPGHRDKRVQDVGQELDRPLPPIQNTTSNPTSAETSPRPLASQDPELLAEQQLPLPSPTPHLFTSPTNPSHGPNIMRYGITPPRVPHLLRTSRSNNKFGSSSSTATRK
ncbi:hypothetical protein BZG36_00719 [Bifiguratus adelaidae]|uniref:Defect at low temperature protein 1 n=1 Tax=Bifiguratus adelaidae TaxID=1938954 RepID=A0A261Y6Y7_9FUNG|nr:hypothetical protein BZG36_00719 [Bifiguratus adelaidae]